MASFSHTHFKEKLICFLAVWSIANGFSCTPRAVISGDVVASYRAGALSSLSPISRQRSGYFAPSRLLMTLAEDEETETAETKAAKLRAMAAELRSQAMDLEAKYALEKKEAAEKSFIAFDTNDDGMVDLQELREGLEGQLRRDFVKRLTKRLDRKPSPEEIEEKISEMPGGSLFPEEVGKMLLEIYDKNGDGVLQRDEFVPADEMRQRLDVIFAERAQAERDAAAAIREKEIEARGEKKQKQASRRMGLPLPEDFNNAPPTAADRALSTLPYLLPLLDSVAYGGHLFQTYPEQLWFAAPLVGLFALYRSVPLAGLVFFFGAQFLSTRPSVNKLVRFNLRQAVNLDVALFFPSFLGLIISGIAGDDIGKLAPIANACSDVVFVTILLSVAYSIISSAFGVLPVKLPILGPMNRENPDRKDGYWGTEDDDNDKKND
ncbi:unnamed protein product [Choristocarpus tenellus]